MVAGDAGRLQVGAGAIFTAIAWVKLHRRRKGARKSIVAIKKKRPFVIMAVPGEDQIDSVALQNRKRVLPHFDQSAVGVGIMASLAIGRMVPKGDDPILEGGR